MRPTMSNNIVSRCRTGCRTTTGELFTHTLCPSASAVEARKRLCFPDLFLVVSSATVTLEYLSRGLSVCRAGYCLSHQAHYASPSPLCRVSQCTEVSTWACSAQASRSISIQTFKGRSAPNERLWMENFARFVKQTQITGLTSVYLRSFLALANKSAKEPAAFSF